MKRIILLTVLAAMVAFPVLAQDAPTTDPAAASGAPAPATEKLEGKVIVTKGADGAADTYTFKTADAELTLLPGDKLTELLKVEKYEEKTFIIEGEKVTGKDGKQGFMVKAFEEKKDAAAASDAPAAASGAPAAASDAPAAASGK